MASKKISSKSELSKNDVKIVVIVVIFIVAIIIGAVEIMFLYSPKSLEAKSLQDTFDSLQVKVEEAKRVPNQIASYRTQIEQLEGKTFGDEEETPELRQEIDVPTILQIVENAAASSEMKLKSVTMDGNAAYIKGGLSIAGGTTEDGTAENTSVAFYKLGVALDVDAVSYDGLMNFLSTFEDAGYYVTTSKASLEYDKVSGAYKGPLNFYVYSLVSSKK